MKNSFAVMIFILSEDNIALAKTQPIVPILSIDIFYEKTHRDGGSLWPNATSLPACQKMGINWLRQKSGTTLYGTTTT
jgi:hypothetical protein